MGIAIQQWRAQIGNFYGICTGKLNFGLSLPEAESCNIHAIKIYMLKGCCRVIFIFSLLLLLSGDIEMNPGPCTVFTNLPIFGHYHQGSNIFTIDSRGKQSVSCCLAFFLKNEMKSDGAKWSRVDIDSTLFVGDYIYQAIFSNYNMNDNFLHPRDLPDMVDINSSNFSVKLKKTYSGNLYEGYVGEYPLISLENAISISFYEKYLMFICRGNASAIYICENQFIVFDPHSRDSEGYCVQHGKSVVIRKNNLKLLSKYLRKLILSCGSKDLNIQYDLHVFNLCLITNNQSVKRAKANRKFVCTVPEQPLQTSLHVPHNIAVNGSQAKDLNRGLALVDLHFLEPQENFVADKQMTVNCNPQENCTVRKQKHVKSKRNKSHSPPITKDTVTKRTAVNQEADLSQPPKKQCSCSNHGPVFKIGPALGIKHFAQEKLYRSISQSINI